MTKLYYNYHLSGVLQPVYRRVRFGGLGKIFESKLKVYDPDYLKNLGVSKNPTLYYDPLNNRVTPNALISNVYGSMYSIAPPNMVSVEYLPNPINDDTDVFKKQFHERKLDTNKIVH